MRKCVLCGKRIKGKSPMDRIKAFFDHDCLDERDTRPFDAEAFIENMVENSEDDEAREIVLDLADTFS